MICAPPAPCPPTASGCGAGGSCTVDITGRGRSPIESVIVGGLGSNGCAVEPALARIRGALGESSRGGAMLPGRGAPFNAAPEYFLDTQRWAAYCNL